MTAIIISTVVAHHNTGRSLISCGAPPYFKSMPACSQLRDALQAKSGGLSLLVMMMLVPPVIGFLLALLIWKSGSTDIYNMRIAIIYLADQHWSYLSAVVFCRLVNFLNMYPTCMHRAKIMRDEWEFGNVRANMSIYKAIGQNAAPNAVVMVEDGDVGAYNRANRSMHHFVENAAHFCVGVVMATAVFPFPTFVLVAVFALGRVAHQTGYTTGYGAHRIGFGISQVCTLMLEGLCLVVFLKGAGVL